MGYFSNGAEGEWYEELICGRCINYKEYKDGYSGCPILFLHQDFNGAKEGSEAQIILDTLIPLSDVPGYNGLCSMWKPIEEKYNELPSQYEKYLKRSKGEW